MPRHFSTALLVVGALVAMRGTLVAQQSRDRGGDEMGSLQPFAELRGVVTDAHGVRLNGARIVAMGATMVLAQTDAAGQFRVSLEPGDYVLRASREGYISTYREPVRIQSRATLERHITLTRSSSFDDGAAPVADGSEPGDHAHSEVAWRLRHLPRTVLREWAASGVAPSGGPETMASALARNMGPAGAASFFSGSTFRGQVNFLATSAVSSPDADGRRGMDAWPRGVAYVTLGAPVGVGDWSVKAAISAGQLPAWTFLGEYQSRPSQAHAIRAGASLSSQAMLAAPGRPLVVTGSAESRSVGSIYAVDEWRAASWIDVAYGVRVERFDYLGEQAFVSPKISSRIAVTPRTWITLGASEQLSAPGEDQFLPPLTAGVWLPPERTFSALSPQTTLSAERIVRYDVGVERALNREASQVVYLRRFSEGVDDQMATLFGLQADRPAGHYFVGVPGDVQVDGWAVGASSHVGRRLLARVDYASARGTWSNIGQASLRHVAPSSFRAASERLHDLSTSFEASLPETATHVTLAVRVDSAFAGSARPRLGRKQARASHWK